MAQMQKPFRMAMTLGLAAAIGALPAPFLSSSANAQSGVLPSDPQDFQCFVLLQQRRKAFVESPTLDPVRRAEFVNNLTIISAFYAGRISHYSSAEMVASFDSAIQEVAAASPQQRDGFANICANFYFRVMNVLSATLENTQPEGLPQAPPPPSPETGGVPQR